MTWPLASLGDLVILKTGPFGSSLHQSEYVVGGIPLINPTHIQNGRLVPDATVTVSEKKFATLRDFALEAGDVVMGRRGEMGRCAVVTEVERGWLCGTGSIIVRPKNEIDSTFLQRFLSSPNTARRLEGNSVGITMVNLNQKILLGLNIPIPPLAEQRRIAAILDKADALRAKRREAIAKLDQLLQSVFLDMFGDPVSNPKHWSETSLLGDVADIVSGVTKGRRTTLPTRKVPYLAVSNVQDRALKLEAIKMIDATDDEIDRYRLVPDDLLLTEGGDPDKLGRGALWKGELNECIHQNHVFRVRLTSKNLHPIFLSWLVGSARGKRYFAKQAKQTTGIASINMRQLRGFPLLVPPIALQERFADLAKRLQTQRVGIQRNTERLDVLFASLQHRAFSGTL